MAFNLQAELDFPMTEFVHLLPMIYRRVYDEFELSDYVNINFEADWTDEFIAKRIADSTGRMAMVNSLSTAIPTVNYREAQSSSPLRYFKLGAYYDYREVAKMMRRRGVADMTPAMDAISAMMDDINEIAFFRTLEESTLPDEWDALLNPSGVNSFQADNTGTGSSRQWKDKNGLQIIDDINAAILEVVDRMHGKRRYLPDTLVLGTKSYSELCGKAIGDVNEWLINSLPNNNLYTFWRSGAPLTVIPNAALDRIPGLTAGKERAILYCSDPSCLEFQLPLEPQIMPPGQNFTWTGNGWNVVFHTVVGGLTWWLKDSAQFITDLAD